MKPDQRTSWALAVPVLALLLWCVVYPNVTIIAGSFAHGLGYWRAEDSDGRDVRP